MNIKYFSITQKFSAFLLRIKVAFYKLFCHNLNNYWFISKKCIATSEENEYLQTLLYDFTRSEDKYPSEQNFFVKAPSNFMFVWSRRIKYKKKNKDIG